MHKPTIHCKTSKSSFLHHPLTELLLITTICFIFPHDLLSSSYTTVSVIQLKIHLSRNVHSNSVFVLHLLTAQELIASFLRNAYKVSRPNFARRCVVEGGCHLWHKCKSDNCVLYAILARSEKLHFAENGQFMHRHSQFCTWKNSSWEFPKLRYTWTSIKLKQFALFSM